MGDFKSEIKLFLIVALIAVVLAVGGVLLLRNVQEQNEFRDPHEPAAIEQHIQQQVTEFLKLNINSYVQAEPVLGAPKFFVDDVEFYDGNKFIATFEDGHILGYMLGVYSTEGGNVQIQYLAETFNNEFNNEGEPSLEELKLQHGFINGMDTSNWQTYRNDEYGFQLVYPSGWTVEGTSIVNPTTGSSFGVVQNGNPNNLSLDEWFRQATLIGDRPTVKAAAERITINGVPAYKLEAGLTPPNPLFEVVAIANNQGDIFSIYAHYGIQEDAAILNQILSTFRFIQ